MDVRIHHGDRMRIVSDHKGNNFVDIAYREYEGQMITFRPWSCYLELRKKDKEICMFSWNSKRHKKEADLGWWNDAEVIWSCNEIGK